jgi:hypothetical protein
MAPVSINDLSITMGNITMAGVLRVAGRVGWEGSAAHLWPISFGVPTKNSLTL